MAEENRTRSDLIADRVDVANKAMTELLVALPDCERPQTVLGAPRACFEVDPAASLNCKPCGARQYLFNAARYLQWAAEKLSEKRS